ICLNFVDAETNCTGNSCRRRKLRKQFCASLSYGRFHTAWALFGHGAMSDLSPLSGVKRKLDFGAVRAAFDPTRTSSAAFQGSPLSRPKNTIAFCSGLRSEGAGEMTQKVPYAPRAMRP